MTAPGTVGPNVPTGQRYASSDGVQIAYDTVGPQVADPLLLIMGTGGQLIHWPEGFCSGLAERGFTVARFDNRDAGLSTHLDSAPVPHILNTLLRAKSAAVYGLDDMADDAVAVLDALAWPAAHVAGISMGGMIAQTMAIRHPTRVRTLISIGSTPYWRLGRQRVSVSLRMARPALRRVRSSDDAARQAVDMARVFTSPAYPADEAALEDVARRAYDRHPFDMAGVQRQNAAIAAAGDRRAALAKLRVPTLVIHGEDDPLIRVDGGRATAAAIPGALLLTFPGMRHDLPRELWPTIIDAIRDLADQAAAEERPEPRTASEEEGDLLDLWPPPPLQAGDKLGSEILAELRADER